MTTSEQFITHLNDVFDSKGLKLISDFFITFSRFECALKTSITYSNERKGKMTSAILYSTFRDTAVTIFLGSDCLLYELLAVEFVTSWNHRKPHSQLRIRNTI